jgi:hypothetical protein
MEYLVRDNGPEVAAAAVGVQPEVIRQQVLGFMVPAVQVVKQSTSMGIR